MLCYRRYLELEGSEVEGSSFTLTSGTGKCSFSLLSSNTLNKSSAKFAITKSPDERLWWQNDAERNLTSYLNS